MSSAFRFTSNNVVMQDHETYTMYVKLFSGVPTATLSPSNHSLELLHKLLKLLGHIFPGASASVEYSCHRAERHAYVQCTCEPPSLQILFLNIHSSSCHIWHCAYRVSLSGIRLESRIHEDRGEEAMAAKTTWIFMLKLNQKNGLMRSKTWKLPWQQIH